MKYFYDWEIAVSPLADWCNKKRLRQLKCIQRAPKASFDRIKTFPLEVRELCNRIRTRTSFSNWSFFMSIHSRIEGNGANKSCSYNHLNLFRFVFPPPRFIRCKAAEHCCKMCEKTSTRITSLRPLRIRECLCMSAYWRIEAKKEWARDTANRYFVQTKRPCRSLFNFVPHLFFYGLFSTRLARSFIYYCVSIERLNNRLCECISTAIVLISVGTLSKPFKAIINRWFIGSRIFLRDMVYQRASECFSDSPWSRIDSTTSS